MSHDGLSRRPRLSPTQRKHLQAQLKHLAGLTFRNESEVEHFLINELLFLLGYRFPDNIQSTPRLKTPGRRVGSRRETVVVPDRLVSVNGQAVLVVEAKGPHVVLGKDVEYQAYSYAVHPDVQARRLLLTNGRKIRVVDTRLRAPLFECALDALPEHFAELDRHVGFDALSNDLGGLSLKRIISRGPITTVYEVWNPRVRRAEALKVFHVAPHLHERWLNRVRSSVKATAGLRIEGLLDVFDVISVGRSFGILMRYSPGAAMDVWSKRQRPSFRVRMQVYLQVVRTVASLHSAGVAHRDLKPSNVLVERSGKHWRTQLVDIDTAVASAGTLITRSADGVGTLGYVAPEVLRASTLPTRVAAMGADVYSLGALLHYLLTDRVPGARENYRTIERGAVFSRRVPKRSRKFLLHVISKALQVNPEQRYTDAVRLLSDIETSPHTGEGSAIAGLRELRSSLTKALRNERSAVLKSRPSATAWEDESYTGWYLRVSKAVTLIAIFDYDYDGFMVGLSFETMNAFNKYRRSAVLSRLRKLYGSELIFDAPTETEDGGATVFTPLSTSIAERPSAVIRKVMKQWDSFVDITNPGSPATKSRRTRTT